MFKRLIPILALILVGGYIGYSYPKPSIFYEAERIHVPSHVEVNEVIPMEVDRTIVRPFTGEFLVNVKELHEDQKISYCTGSGAVVYNPEMVLPETGTDPHELNLGWWIGKSNGDDCTKGMISKPGTYVIETCWKIERPLTFTITTCKNSNTFIVKDS